MARAYVVGTFDTKGTELGYVADLIRATSVPVTTVDVSTTTGTAGAVDVPAREVAGCHPGGAGAVFTGDRGESVTAMAEAFRRFLAARDDVGGVLGIGGSGNTALVTPAMRELPVGVPKVMVSTLASGNVAPYVGASDIFMLHSVTDVAGLNRISRVVLGNAAHALAGMLSHRPPPDADRPAIALSMFGVTTPCVTAAVDRLQAEYDCLIFHATGTGGNAMEKLVDDGLISAVLDVTTTEVCDHIAGGVLSAGEDRIGAIARTEVPYVGSCGALDMVNFGALDTVPQRYRERNLYVHNPQVTLMRTTPKECEQIAEFIAAKLNACQGQARFLLPEGGVSMLDAPGQPFHDPEADQVLFDTLERLVEQTERRRLVRVPHNVNDAEFVDELVTAFREVVTA